MKGVAFVSVPSRTPATPPPPSTEPDAASVSTSAKDVLRADDGALTVLDVEDALEEEGEEEDSYEAFERLAAAGVQRVAQPPREQQRPESLA